MLKKRVLLVAVLVGLAILSVQVPVSHANGVIRVSGFGYPRNRGDFSMTGGLGGSNIWNNFSDPNKFGPSGIVPCTVQLLPLVQTIATGSLVDAGGNLLVDVFLAGLTATTLTTAEATELSSFLSAGGILYISGNTATNEGQSYNPLFTQLGISDQFLSSTTGPQSYGTTSIPISTPVTTGPFGVVGPLTHTPFRDFSVVSLTGVARGYDTLGVYGYIVIEGSIGSGYISITGDPLYFNLFTNTDSDNLNYFLNLVALACKPPVPPVPESNITMPLMTTILALSYFVITALRRRKYT